ncbi:hypothetical protein [Hyphomicrobium sp. D-2]|uniref:hypothetical protein n=1 Tax=Hyphomicrobium sp. D-2 TaxID=3041621 RepID=UPI0024555A5C|nr:hypothetical protein [Hyphomicrobium sp. D-2]MDH4983271.1 hypothetical protein [Hyphomicrobium sp. D-2]
MLGVIFVIMALGLEISKPFAVDGAFHLARRFKLLQATALALVAVLAVAYSLQAELTFMSMTRGDLVAQRATVHDAAQRAEQRYQLALAELGALKPAGTSKSATNAYLTRREALQNDLRAAETDRRTAPVAITADPGAIALSTYAQALGWKADPAQLGLWLPLIGVLALEVASAFAVVLVRSSSPQPPAPAPAGEPVNAASADQAGSAAEPPANTGEADPREKVKSAVLNHLAERGGSAVTSERGLAALIGSSKPTVRRAIHALTIAGVIAAQTTRNGTVLRLVA